MSTRYDYDWILNPRRNALYKHELEMGTDTLPAQNKNYVGNPVYTTNRWGCRVPDVSRDWSSLDPEQCVAIVGCSQTWGIGLEYVQTVSHNLETLEGITVLNLAMPAASPSWIADQCLELLSRYRPKGLAVIWSDPHRYHDWHTPAPLGLWTGDVSNLWCALVERERHLYTVAMRSQRMVRTLAQALAVPFAEASWSTWWADRVPLVLSHQAPDRARDGQHWGPASTKILARSLKEQLDENRATIQAAVGSST